MSAETVAAVVRVAVYVRISQIEAQGDTYGVARQLAEVMARLDEWFGVGGWVLVPDLEGPAWSDNGHSATTGRVRPAFERLMAACRFGHVDYVVCWATDRLYRKASELERIIETFNSAGVGFRVVRQVGPLDLTTAAGRLMARTVGNFNQYEGEIKGERIQSQVRQMIDQGCPPATVARYGYRRVSWGRKKGATLEQVEHEVVVVRVVVRRILDGLSCGQVADELNAAGHRNRAGQPFTREAVRRMVISPVIAGRTILHGEDAGRGNWTPIVDLVTWERVQAELTDPNRKAQRKRTRYWLRGDPGDGRGLWDQHGAYLRGSRAAPGPKWPEGRRVYRTAKVTIDAVAVERFALEIVGDSIDLIELRLPGDVGGEPALTAHDQEMARIEEGLAALARERARGELLQVEYQAGRVELVHQLEALKRDAPRQPKRPFRVAVGDVRRRWPLPPEAGGFSEAERQEIVRAALGRVTVLPGGSGRDADEEVVRARLVFEPIER